MYGNHCINLKSHTVMLFGGSEGLAIQSHTPSPKTPTFTDLTP
jgi:hypothetical protein